MMSVLLLLMSLSAVPDAGTPDPLEVTLKGSASDAWAMSQAEWALELLLDPVRPSGTLTTSEGKHPLTKAKLDVLRHEPLGSLERTEYRLRFQMDACLHAQLAPPEAMGGPCGGGVTGAGRAVLLRSYELLVSVHGTHPGPGSASVYQVSASCVPTSGAGPSCHVEGTVTRRSK